jgi:hypothetical protein
MDRKGRLVSACSRSPVRRRSRSTAACSSLHSRPRREPATYLDHSYLPHPHQRQGAASRVSTAPIRARTMCWPTPEVRRYRPYVLAMAATAGAPKPKRRSAQRLILQSARKPLRLNTPILGSFTAKSLYCLIRNLTLNQRVQGSSACVPTNLKSNIDRVLGNGCVGRSLTVRRPLYIFQWLSRCINLRRCH